MGARASGPFGPWLRWHWIRINFRRDSQHIASSTLLTESAILAVHNDIVRAVDQGDVVAVVLLDLSSAFDTVDHSTLLHILQSSFSLTGSSLAWFQSYLSDRTQTFTTRSSQSQSIPLNCGVPQLRIRTWSCSVSCIHRRYHCYLFITQRLLPLIC